jgi:S1-C subfamily serine protease
MRRIYLAILFVFLMVAAILPLHRSYTVRAVSEGERLAMFSKPAVVKVWGGAEGSFIVQLAETSPARQYQINNEGWGSGFFINPDGYIATNAHVTKDFHDGEEKLKDGLWEALFIRVARDNNVDPRALTQAQKQFIFQHSKMTGFFAVHHVIIPDGSVFPFEIKAFGAPVGEGENWKDVSIIKIEVKNAPSLLFGDSDKMQLQDHISVIGYPGAAETNEYPNMLNKQSQLESTINDGKISARKSTEGGAPILQISASTTHGNSGGPVLNDANEVIGLLTFRGNTVNGQEVQGFNFVVAANTVKEFLGGAKNELGSTDAAYREGLEYYWKGEFKNAIPKFEEVKRLFPQHSEVGGLIQRSQQGITEGKDKSGFGAAGLIIIVVVVVVIIVAVIIIAVVGFLLVRRGKSKSPKPAPMAARPSPAPPQAHAAPTPAPTPPPAATPAHVPPLMPYITPGDQGKTVDLSATIAISRNDTAPMSFGSIHFISGVLTGQKFEIKSEGSAIGRDSGSAQIVIADPRISKRHVWIGVRDGRVAIIDEGSRNGTFLNDPKSSRVTEAFLTPGDCVILGESDVARFEYQM